MTHALPDSLFHEFPAVSRETWKKRAVADLGEKPYESIVWHTPDGFDMEPWFSPEAKTNFLEVPNAKTTNTWRNCHRIIVHDLKTANSAALRALEQDALALEFSITDTALCTPENFNILFSGIETSAIAIYFSGDLPSHHDLLEILIGTSGFKATSGGILTAPPLASKELDRKLFELSDAIPGFTPLSIDTTAFHTAGSTAAQEIAFALGGASDLLNRFLLAGIPAERIVSAMEIILPVSSSHFTELAKPRALRALLPFVMKAYGASGTSIPRLFARSSERNRSLLDPYTNLLRQTTEAVSAILGGYDTLQLAPFDIGLSVQPEVTARITGNIHLVLKEEGWLDRVVDPASGSQYIETLTRKLAEEAWKIFKAIEAEGGLEKAIKSGSVHQMISSSASSRISNINKRKKTLLGVNRYTWPLTPEQEESIESIEAEAKKMDESNETAAFELLRLKTLSWKLKTGKAPSVFIWMQGDPAVSFRQASFCEDFFKCGGFNIEAISALAPGEQAYNTVLKQKPDIVVLCIAEKDPAPLALTIATSLSHLQNGIITVMAGKPPKEHEQLLKAGIDSFIYTGVNVLEMLKSYQHKTGVQ
jgi:methylmalonyl-CoA mutase